MATTLPADNLAVNLNRRLALAAEDSQTREKIQQQHLNFGESFPHLDMPLPEMSLLIMFIGGLGIHGVDGEPFMKPNLIKMDYAVKLVQQAANMLQDWPSTFNKSLQKFTAAHHKKGRLGLVAQFGYMYQYMYSCLASTEFNFLREQFELHIRDNFTGLLDSKRLRNVSTRTQEAGRYVSSTVACKKLRTAWTRLKTLTEMGELPALVLHDKSGRSFTIYERAGLEHLLAKRDDTVSLEASKALLGFNSKWRIREIRKEGLLSAGHAPANSVIKCPLSKAAIKTLVTTLTGTLPIIAAPLPPGQKNLQRLLRYPLSARGVFPDFVKSVLDKRTVPLGKVATIAGLNGIVFREADVVSFLKRRQGCADYLCVDECAAALQVARATVYHLMKGGLLKYCILTIGHQRQRFVSPGEISRFRNRYVITPELARLTKMPRRSVERRLIRESIKPKAAPKENRVGINLYPRRAVERLEWTT